MWGRTSPAVDLMPRLHPFGHCTMPHPLRTHSIGTASLHSFRILYLLHIPCNEPYPVSTTMALNCQLASSRSEHDFPHKTTFPRLGSHFRPVLVEMSFA